MKSVKKIQQQAKDNLHDMISRLNRDLQLTRGMFADTVVMEGSPAQIYSHLSALSGELDQISEMAVVMQEEIKNIK